MVVRRDEDWSHIESHFDDLVIRPAIPSRTQGPVDTALLDRRQRDSLREAIRQHRAAYAAQARVNRSTAPVFVNGGVEAWPIGMRVFAAADREGHYQVMPGGLARAMPPTHGQAPLPGRRRRHGPMNPFPVRGAKTSGSSPIGRFPR